MQPLLLLIASLSGLVSTLVAAESDVPVVSIRATFPSTREPLCDPAICDAPLPAPGVFVITRRGGDLTRELSVLLRYEGTASNGKDYAVLAPRVLFGMGVDSVQLFVEATFDQVVEGEETVLARLLPDPSLGPVERYRVEPTQSVARVVIRDHDRADATLELTAPKEGAVFAVGAPVEIEATAIDPAGAITRVEFFDGDTQTGESEIVFIRQPDPGTPIYHEFIWKDANAGFHTLTARAVDSQGNQISSPPIHITVGPDRPVVSIRATRPITSEPCPVCRVAPGVFTFSRTGSTNEPLSLSYLLDGTAQNGEDYFKLSGRVTIPAGRDSVDVQVVGAWDDLTEGDETVVARPVVPEVAILIFPPPPPPYRIDPNNAEATVVIRDFPFTPPAAAMVSIVATDPLARAGTDNRGAPGRTATFVVTRAGPTNDALTVRYAMGGTASNGVDYATLSSPLRIPAGARRASLVITPLHDSQLERIETVVVTLLADDAVPANYSIGRPRRAAALIVDSDSPRPPCLRLPDGLFNVCFLGETNPCVRVEATRDLVGWTPLCTVPVNDGVAHFVDPDTPEMLNRFYRLVPVPCEP